MLSSENLGTAVLVILLLEYNFRFLAPLLHTFLVLQRQFETLWKNGIAAPILVAL